MKTWIPLLAALAIVSPLHAEPLSPPAAEAGVMSDGVVRRIDLSNGKITLKHGPIANLDMPPMTMVYTVRPPSLLKGLNVGDTVKFHAEEVDGNYIVTAIHAVR